MMIIINLYNKLMKILSSRDANVTMHANVNEKLQAVFLQTNEIPWGKVIKNVIRFSPLSFIPIHELVCL